MVIHLWIHVFSCSCIVSLQVSFSTTMVDGCEDSLDEDLLGMSKLYKTDFNFVIGRMRLRPIKESRLWLPLCCLKVLVTWHLMLEVDAQLLARMCKRMWRDPSPSRHVGAKCPLTWSLFLPFWGSIAMSGWWLKNPKFQNISKKQLDH